MAALPYMKFYVADYLADTIHLDVIESGAYLHLIFNYWQTGKPLPDDDSRLARIAKCTPEQWQCIRNAIASFFEINDGVAWMHKRIERDLKSVKSKSEAQKKAAKIRWGKEKIDNAKAYAPALKRQSHTDTDTDTDTEDNPNGLSSMKSTPRKELETVLDSEHADAVIEHRKRIRKPLTPRAAKLLAANFSKADDPNEAADVMVMNGWQGFDVSWMPDKRYRGKPTGRDEMLDALDRLMPDEDYQQ